MTHTLYLEHKAAFSSARACPLRFKLGDKRRHDVVALAGQRAPSRSLHRVTQRKELFVKVVERWCRRRGSTRAVVQTQLFGRARGESGIVQRLSDRASVRKAAGDADRAHGVEAVCVLHNGQGARRRRRRRCTHRCTLNFFAKAHAVNDVNNGRARGCRHALRTRAQTPG